jgi:hypothetical protein
MILVCRRSEPRASARWRLGALLGSGCLVCGVAAGEDGAPVEASERWLGSDAPPVTAPPTGSESVAAVATGSLVTDAAPRLAPRPSMSLDSSVTALSADRPLSVEGQVSDRLLDVSHRVWLGYGRGAVGFGVGTLGYVVTRDANPADPRDRIGLLLVPRPTMSVSLRYSLSASSSVYATASAVQPWRRDEGATLYNTRAGVEWKPAQSRFGFEGGRLGVQLDSGYRMSLRTKGGGVGIYLRRNF